MYNLDYNMCFASVGFWKGKGYNQIPMFTKVSL
jgi:hypothetical protein